MKIRQLISQDAQQYLNMRLEALQKNPEAFASSYQEEKYSSLGFEVFGTEKKAMKYNNIYFDENHMVLFL